jgi:DNA (cytosine-5)-methyltransferase 1
MNDLPLRFAKTAISLSPSVIVMEEVPAFRISPNYARVVRTLQDAGYFVTSSVLNAADYQTPQSRKRNILIASKKSLIPQPNPCPGKKLSAGSALLGVTRRGSEVSPRLAVKIRDTESGYLKSKAFATKYRIMKLSQPAPTITTKYGNAASGEFTFKRQGKYFHMSKEEASALQGFPSTFAFSGNITETTKQIGNAIPPPLAFAVGKQVLKYI